MESGVLSLGRKRLLLLHFLVLLGWTEGDGWERGGESLVSCILAEGGGWVDRDAVEYEDLSQSFPLHGRVRDGR